jgi:hypothetical protein
MPDRLQTDSDASGGCLRVPIEAGGSGRPSASSVSGHSLAISALTTSTGTTETDSSARRTVPIRRRASSSAASMTDVSTQPAFPPRQVGVRPERRFELAAAVHHPAFDPRLVVSEDGGSCRHYPPTLVVRPPVLFERRPARLADDHASGVAASSRRRIEAVPESLRRRGAHDGHALKDTSEQCSVRYRDSINDSPWERVRG